MAKKSNIIKFATDGMRNLISGLGTSADKSFSTTYTFCPISDEQLVAAYRGDWVARKIIDIPAKDATREWRDWQAEDDQITAIEAEETRLGLRNKLRYAISMARLYGGAVIILGIEGDDPAEPLDPKTIKPGGLSYIHVLTRTQITATEIDRDPLSATHGEPFWYDVNSVGQMARVHPSRVVRLIGNDVPANISNEVWGDSVLFAVDDAVKQAGVASASLSALIQEAKTDIVKIPDLMDNLSTDAYEQKLLDRFALAGTAKSVVNTYVMDKEEEWQRINTNFAGLPEAIKLYLLIASGAADIPATRMLGQSASGLNATGDGDIRNYYDMVADVQETTLRPALAKLDAALIASAGIADGDHIYYDWSPLWQMDAKQKAEIAKLKADTTNVINATGLVDPIVLSEAYVNQLIEDGVFPGLDLLAAEAVMKEIDLPEDEPEGPVDPSTGLPITKSPKEEAALAAAALAKEEDDVIEE